MTTPGSARPVRTLLAFRNGSIGNSMVAVPALRALKRRHPDARLVVVVDPIGADLLGGLDFIDRLIVYDRRGRHRGVGGWLRFVRTLRRERPDQAILFKRFFRNELLAFLSGAGVRVGFRTGARPLLLTRTLNYRESTSITRLNLALAALLDADPGDATPELALLPADRERAAELRRVHDLEPASYLVGHYGGLSTDPAFLSVSRFRKQLEETALPGEPILLIGAGPREAAWAAAIANGGGRWRILVDQPVRVTAALIASARHFVGMNSGPAHLAAAVGTPATVLFRPGPGAAAEMAKWRPESMAAAAVLVPTVEPGVGLAIPAYRDADRLRRALEAVRLASPALLDRTVVVDDSGDGQVATGLRPDFPGVRWLVHESNRGFGRSATEAVLDCPAGIVILLNDDTELLTDPVAALTHHFERADLFAITFRSVDERDRFREGAKRLVWPFGLPRIRHNERDQRPAEAGLIPSDYAVGGHAAFHRDKFAALQGFDPLFEPFYWEDVDLSRRAAARGWHIGYEPSIVVRHAADGAIRGSVDARRIRVITQANRVVFGRRHRPRGMGLFQELALAWYAFTDPVFREALASARRRASNTGRQARAADASSIEPAAAATASTDNPSGA